MTRFVGPNVMVTLVTNRPKNNVVNTLIHEKSSEEIETLQEYETQEHKLRNKVEKEKKLIEMKKQFKMQSNMDKLNRLAFKK